MPHIAHVDPLKSVPPGGRLRYDHASSSGIIVNIALPFQRIMVSQSHSKRHLMPLAGTVIALFFVLTGCVYELDVQQGNKLEPDDVEKVEVGMTRSQVRFLLGTPVISDVFREDRWDYLYYFKAGRSTKAERRWVIVWFDGNVVREIERDVRTNPG